VEESKPQELKLISKIGEVSGVRVHQVLGDPHWHSTPTIALQVHNTLKNHSYSDYKNQPKRGRK
jgi:hypothetical protein